MRYVVKSLLILVLFLVFGCGQSKEEIRAQTVKSDEEKMRQLAAEEKRQKAEINKELVGLTPASLSKVLSDCQNLITTYSGAAWKNHSVGSPEVVTLSSTHRSQAEAYVLKVLLYSDKSRITSFRNASPEELNSGEISLNTKYPVLVREDSFSGLQPKIVSYQCRIASGLRLEVLPY